MFYNFISKTIISKSLIFIKAISTPKTISKSLIFLVLIYQLLLIKLDFKIYLRWLGAHGPTCDPRWRAPPRCGGRGSAGRPNPGARGPSARRRAAAGGRPWPGATRAAARGSERAGGGAGGAGQGIKRGCLPPVGSAVGTCRRISRQ